MQFCIPRTWNGNNCAVCNLADGNKTEGGVSELPLIVVIEDEYALQEFVDDALQEAGFETEM